MITGNQTSQKDKFLNIEVYKKKRIDSVICNYVIAPVLDRFSTRA